MNVHNFADTVSLHYDKVKIIPITKLKFASCYMNRVCGDFYEEMKNILSKNENDEVLVKKVCVLFKIWTATGFNNKSHTKEDNVMNTLVSFIVTEIYKLKEGLLELNSDYLEHMLETGNSATAIQVGKLSKTVYNTVESITKIFTEYIDARDSGEDCFWRIFKDDNEDCFLVIGV